MLLDYRIAHKHILQAFNEKAQVFPSVSRFYSGNTPLLQTIPFQRELIGKVLLQ